MMAEWFIFGAVVFIGWALERAIASAHSTLIALNQTLTAFEGNVASIQDELHGTLFALKADVAAIRDRVAPEILDDGPF